MQEEKAKSHNEIFQLLKEELLNQNRSEIRKFYTEKEEQELEENLKLYKDNQEKAQDIKDGEKKSTNKSNEVEEHDSGAMKTSTKINRSLKPEDEDERQSIRSKSETS
jgi:hypothetical protein